jgi:hydroxymethylpyrimidine/phosphomethylpyrimidine kinase
VLSIAGSDSGGGAGIQADLKAFAFCGVHGMTAISAITVQNTVAVQDVHQVPAGVIVAQVRAVVEDIGVDAVKIGMLGSEQTATGVAEALAVVPGAVPVVVDPVMVSESGSPLLEPAAEHVLVEAILPRATVVTPNVPEATVLARAADASARAGDQAEGDVASGGEVATGGDGGEVDVPALARAVHTLGARVVIVTGGHRVRVADLYYDGEREEEIAGERMADGAAHGSGCTHSSLLAALLALGLGTLEAARGARLLAGRAVAAGLRDVGAGAGPVDIVGLARRRLETLATVSDAAARLP